MQQPRTQMESMDDNNMETTNSTASVGTSIHPPTNTITSVSTFQTRQEANNPVQHWKNRCMELNQKVQMKQDGLSAKNELLKTTRDKTRQMTKAHKADLQTLRRRDTTILVLKSEGENCML